MRTRVVCANQQFSLTENLRRELRKSGMHSEMCEVRWEAARADEGVVGQHTGRLAEETGSFSEITQRCRSWWGKATTFSMHSEGYEGGGSFRGVHADFSPLLPHPPLSLANLESGWQCPVAPPPAHLGEPSLPPCTPMHTPQCSSTCPVGFCGGWTLCRMLSYWSLSAPQQQLQMPPLAKQTEFRSKKPVFQGGYLALSGLPLK